MTLAFFEVQNWEKDLLQKEFPTALITEEKLSAENVEKYKDAEIVSTFIYSYLNKEILNSLPKLIYVATRSTGYDHIDLTEAKNKNITISNVPEYGSRTVAEFTFSLILSLSRKIYPSILQAKQCLFEHEKIRGVDIFGKTLGVIGLGKIGTEVVKIAHGFRMKILVSTRTKNEDLAKELNFAYADLETLLKESDVVTLHLPFSAETKHTINKENILLMKKGSYIVNTARGGLVETEGVMVALEKGVLDGVALDVLEDEKDLTDEVAVMTSSYKKEVDYKTLCMNHVLINHPKVIITPHNAFNSKEALLRITETTIYNIKEFTQGRKANVVEAR